MLFVRSQVVGCPWKGIGNWKGNGELSRGALRMFCVLTQVGSVCENASSCILYALEIPSVCMLYTLFCMYVTHHTLKKTHVGRKVQWITQNLSQV